MKNLRVAAAAFAVLSVTSLAFAVDSFSGNVVLVSKSVVDLKNANGVVAHCMLTAPAPDGLAAGAPATCSGSYTQSPDGKLAISGTIAAAPKP